MTQPAGVSAPNDGQMSVQDFMISVVALSGVNEEDVEDLPTGRRFVTPNGKIWEVTKGVPAREKDLLIIGLFLDDDDMHAYCVPKREIDDEKMPVLPSRFIISRVSGAVFFETLSLDALRVEMAEEIADLYDVVGSKLRVDCEVESCGASNEANAKFCSECGTKMPEDEEEPEEVQPPGPPPAPPS